VWKRNDFYRLFFGSRQLINVEEVGCPTLNKLKGNRFFYYETHLKAGFWLLAMHTLFWHFLKVAPKQ